MILWEKDGVGLMRQDGTLWLFVRDGNGMHSASLTDDTKNRLICMLQTMPTNAQPGFHR